MSEQHNIRFPRGFNGYPYNTFKLEGSGVPRGYITLAGVAATLVGAYLISAGFRSNKKPHTSHNSQWENATLEYAKTIKADPIYQLPKEN